MRTVAGVAILGVGGFIAVGLIVVFVNGSRANAERARCADNLRRINQLYIQAEILKTKGFPAGTLDVAKLPPDRRLSWIVPGLGRLGYADVGRGIDLAAPWDAAPNRAAAITILPMLICPAILDNRARNGAAALHYPGLAGVGANAAQKSASAQGAGIFRYDGPTLAIDVKDGLSNVLMLLESGSHPGPWIAGGPSTVRPLDPVQRPYIGVGRPFGGAHIGGANAAMADGSGRFITEKIDSRVLELLTGIADGLQTDDSQ